MRADLRADLQAAANSQPPMDSANDLGSRSAESNDIESDALQVRIDPAHTLGDRPAEETSASTGSNGSSAEEALATDQNSAASPSSEAQPAEARSVLPPETIQQLRLQAEQLAGHLRVQQYHLDRREAQLHAQLALEENAIRNNRLWFRERDQELTERSADMAREHAERASELAREHAERVAELARERQELELRQHDLALRSEQFEMRQGEWLAERDAVPPRVAVAPAIAPVELEPEADAWPRQNFSEAQAAAIDAREAELSARAEGLHFRQQNLEEAEALLADGQIELDRGRRQLAADRAAWQEQLDMDRARLADERRRAEAELDKARQLLHAREDHLQRRGAAVDQLRAEVMRAQRETLELRLATDELWAQLAGPVPPAALTQSLSRLRAQLAEQYRLERGELAQQREQLESLGGRLAEQHDKLQRHRQEIEAWTIDRRGEIENHAARLASREEELQGIQEQLAEKHQRLDTERRVYEAEIRRLLGQLREQEGPIQFPGANAA